MVINLEEWKSIPLVTVPTIKKKVKLEEAREEMSTPKSVFTCRQNFTEEEDQHSKEMYSLSWRRSRECTVWEADNGAVPKKHERIEILEVMPGCALVCNEP